MPQRGHPLYLVGTAVSFILAIIGVLWAIPTIGTPGVVWTVATLAIGGFHAYMLFTRER